MYVAYGSEARIRQIGKLPFGAFYAERQVCVELLTNALCSTNVGKGRLAAPQRIDHLLYRYKTYCFSQELPQDPAESSWQNPPMNPDDLKLLLTREMPFGKHKGTLIANLPGNYLNWFAREGFPPGEIGRLLQLMHEIDHNGLTYLLDPLRTKI